MNKNTIKLSYSCMPNMKNIMKQQNEHLLREEQEDEHQGCNCENIENCPLNGQCLTDDNLVYTADVVYNDGEEDVQDTYHGSTAGPFKTRWTEHKSSFRLEYKKKNSTLSKLIWRLKENNIPYRITWSIEKRAQAYKCGTRLCNLCLAEKVIIARSTNPRMINKRSEIMNKCRHRNKYLLSSVRS